MDDVVRVLTDEQWERATRHTGSSTPDDCSITRDGRRLDTAAKMIAYIEEYNRAQAPDAPPPA